MTTSDKISLVALGVSLLSGAMTMFYASAQHKLNKIALRKAWEDEQAKLTANLMVKFMRMGKILRITNEGPAFARRITVTTVNADGLVDQDNLPIPLLRPRQTFDCGAYPNTMTPDAVLVRLEWQDDRDDEQMAEMLVTWQGD